MPPIEDLLNQNPAEIVADIDEFGDPITPVPVVPEVTPVPAVTPEPAVVPAVTPVPAVVPETPVVEPVKPVQTPEDNAKFAEQRRQQQIDQRVQQELDKIRKESPEFQMAQKLSELYGKPIDQLYAEIQESTMQAQAKELNVPVEMIRRQNADSQRTAALEQQLSQLKFDTWVSRVDSESTALKEKYPMLSDEDLNASKMYLLDTLQNPDLPLDRAVYALHGEKITTGFRELAKQEALAEISGRKDSPLPISGTGVSPTNSLTDLEREAATIMGLTEEEYIKWK